uniref:Uncharacterized protein n=1 Tax=Leptobrachium leishanense TaxID=445787 RepID=A0A8C5M9Y2_9ANUR
MATKTSRKKRPDGTTVAPIFEQKSRAARGMQDGGCCGGGESGDAPDRRRSPSLSPGPRAATDLTETMAEGSAEAEAAAGRVDSAPATRQDILHLKSFIASELAHTTKTFMTEVHAIGTRTARLEERSEHIVDGYNELARYTETLADRVSELESAFEDLSNRSRRNNIRIRGLPEKVPSDQLEAVFIGIIKQLLPTLPSTYCLIDRIHRTLGKSRWQNTLPRDVVARLHYSSTHESLIRAARDQMVEYEDHPLSFFQDLAPSTLIKRREWRVVTEVLRSNNVRYTWGFPFHISATYNDCTHTCTHLYKAKDFLKKLGLEIPEAVSQLNAPGALPRLPREWSLPEV